MKEKLRFSAPSAVCQVDTSKKVIFRWKIVLFFAIAMLLTFLGLQKTFGQTTIVNYNFNSGNSFATLAPALATNISSAATGTAAFGTTTGTASGANAFTANVTGNSLKSAVNNSWTFTLGGTKLVTYKTFKVYYQAQKTTIGTNTVTLTYSKNGGAFTSTGITASVGANPLSITTLLTAPFNQVLLSLPVDADNPATSLAFKLTINNSSSGTIQLDNFQVQAIENIPQVSSFTGNTICSGLANGQLTLSTSNGTSPFTVIYNDGIANRTAAGIISGTAFNTFANAAATSNYTLVSVTDAKGTVRTSGFTDGTATVTVNPVPTVNAVNNQTLCKGLAATAITFSGAVSGTTYKWTNSNTAIGLAASGTGNIAAFTTTNTGSAPITSTITVTPSTSSCTGTARTFTITVNPTASVNAVANQTLCKGVSTAAVNFTSAVSGTTYNWANSNTAIGLAASGTGNIPSFITNNTSAVAITSTITVTPSANGCAGTAVKFTITVNPAPTVNAVSNQSICNNTAIAAINFSGAVSGTTYNWSSTGGVVASGTGNIPATTLTNSGTAPLVATVTVIPTANGCAGAARIFTITVNPTPTVNAVSNQTLCKNALITAITFSGNVPTATYSWTNTNSAIGLAASGTGNIASFAAINNGGTPVTATTTVTPSINGCKGTTGSFTITVNPGPSGNAAATISTLCAGQTTSLSATGSSPVVNIPSFSNATSGTITDNNATGITRAITTSGLPATITGLTNISVTLNLAHGNDADIEAYLIKPGGTISTTASGTLKNTIVAGGSICLVGDRGSSGNNFTSTVFSDAAATAISAGSAPFTGTYKPENAFSTLTGNPNGIWTLKVIDDASGTTGTITNWSIKFTYNNGVSYTWASTPAGFTSTSQNPGILSPAVTTNYTLVVKDIINNCTAQSVIPVTVSAVPTNSVAGDPQTIQDGSAITLNANTALAGTGKWAITEGPATDDAQLSNTADATALFTPAGGPGQYKLSWTISNSPCAASASTVIITVDDAQNTIPVANAGNDATLTIPASSFGLNGNSSYDADGNIAAYKWTKISGPAQYLFADSTSATNNVSNLSEGVYVFELTVTDNEGATAVDRITVIINSRILIDMGDAIITPAPDAGGKYWNNMTSARPGIQVENAVTSTNLPTTISLEVVNRIDGTFNEPENGLFVNDPALSDVGDYPSSATSDYAFADLSTTEGSWKFTGLDSLKQYTIKFWGSRSADNRIIQIKLADETIWKEYDAGNNTDYNRAAIFSFNGKKEVSFNIRVKDGSGFGYINIVDISRSDIDSSHIEPPLEADEINCGNPFTIVVLGSSSAYGNGATPIDSAWVNKYTRYVKSKNPQSEVHNLAIPGFTTYDALYPTDLTPPANRPYPDTLHNITKALSYHPNAIIISLPTNDVANDYPLAETQVNFERAIALANAAHIPVWVTTSQPRNNLTPEQYTDLKLYRDWVLTRFGEKAVDFWTTVANPDGTIVQAYNYDNIHVINSGHDIFYKRMLAEKILDTLCNLVPQVPVARAGNDITLTLPTDHTILDGSNSTAGKGTTITYEWKNIVAPPTANFVILDNTSAIATVNSLSKGTYSFVLTVTDNNGLVSTDTVLVSVSNNSRILIDMGDAYVTAAPDASGKYWNNMTSARSGIQVQNAVRTDNVATTVNLEVVNRIDGTFNEPENGMFTNDPPIAAVGDYPSTATSDYAFADVSTTEGNWKFTGLDAAKEYTIKFWGSRTADNRFIQIKRSDETDWQEYDAGNNTDYNRAASFTFTGKTDVSFDIRVKDGSAFGYINIIDINVVSPDADLPAARPFVSTKKSVNTLSLLTTDNKKDITVYPNPSSGNFKIALQSSPEKNKTVSIQVVNASGQVIYQSTSKNSADIIELNIAGRLTSGTYWIYCIVDGEKITKKLFIKH